MSSLLQNIKSRIKNFVNGIKYNFHNRRMYIHIAKGSHVDKNCIIGRHTRINNASHLGPCNIGQFCAIGGRLVVRSSNHHIQYANLQNKFQKNFLGSKIDVAGKSERPVTIGNACWLGDSVIILPDVQVGDGAIIGAGSIVTKNIPPFSIAVGNPARVIKNRFPEFVVDFFLRIKWWDWNEVKLQNNKFFFEIDFSNINRKEVDELERKLND
jgi:virginiamycin A acetyltransferase